jgi:hypothetical protein
MPFRPRGSCGEPPPRPGLAGIPRGQEHAARQDTPAARSTPATPTARRPGQHLTAVRTSAPPRFLRGHRCCPGPPAPACRARDPMRPASRPRQPLTKPLPCPPRPGRRHSPPIPLTPASTPNRPLPPRPRHPATAGHHAGDITDGQPAPNDPPCRFRAGGARTSSRPGLVQIIHSGAVRRSRLRLAGLGQHRHRCTGLGHVGNVSQASAACTFLVSEAWPRTDKAAARGNFVWPVAWARASLVSREAADRARDPRRLRELQQGRGQTREHPPRPAQAALGGPGLPRLAGPAITRTGLPGGRDRRQAGGPWRRASSWRPAQPTGPT